MPTKPRTPPKPIRLAPRYDPQRGSAPPEMIPLVEVSWILKAIAAVFFVAFLCAYATICILYSRSQWQLVLHPSRTVTTTPAALGLPFTQVHFGVDITGIPQLTGWWIPSNTTTNNTALVLHSADGSISDALPSAQLLHAQHLNVLLFDYRGYGQSLGQHPTQTSMQEDAASALSYLTNTRAIPPSQIVLYGTGLGASLAVRLCAENPNLPALILQSPDGDFTTRARLDPRSKIVPFSLLFNQPFPLAEPLQHLPTPRLILPTPPNPAALSLFLTTLRKP
jgi:pimeloyl-ACP methyl ester carboxylesterase